MAWSFTSPGAPVTPRSRRISRIKSLRAAVTRIQESSSSSVVVTLLLVHDLELDIAESLHHGADGSSDSVGGEQVDNAVDRHCFTRARPRERIDPPPPARPRP
jgi:hypothetical protein